MKKSKIGAAGRSIRFCTPYYLINGLLVLSYFFVRSLVVQHSSAAKHQHIWTMEKQALPLLLSVFAVKYWLRTNLEAYLDDVSLYSKVLVVFLMYHVDPRLMGWYAIFFLALYLVLVQPTYDGPAKVHNLTVSQFTELVEEEGKDRGVTWLVLYSAPWSPPCVHLDPTFAELSLRYSTSTLRFAKVDVSRYPRLATYCSINSGAMSSQLPTLVLFEKGEERGRIPHVDKDGKVSKAKLRRADIVRAFELDMRYARSRGHSIDDIQ